MGKWFMWKKMRFVLFGAMIICFCWWVYTNWKKPETQVVETESSTLEKTVAEVCYEQVSQAECYGLCLEGDCTAERCPDRIQQAYCACIGTTYNGKSCETNGDRYKGLSFEDFRRGYYWDNYKREGTPADWVHRGIGTKSEGWFEQ